MDRGGNRQTRVEPGEDILSWLIAAEIDPPGEDRRPLTHEEIVIFAGLSVTEDIRACCGG